MPPLGGQHDEIERVSALDLEPARSAVARLVKRVHRLRHQTFVPGRDGGIVEGARRGLGGSHYSRNAQSCGNRESKYFEALARRKVRDRPLAEAQAVEEK